MAYDVHMIQSDVISKAKSKPAICGLIMGRYRRHIAREQKELVLS